MSEGVVISRVEKATDTLTRDIAVETVLKAIRTGGKKLRGQIEQIRNRFEAEHGKTGGEVKAARLAVEQLKKALPAVTWSGRFSQRASEHLVQHSGLFCADLDSLGQELETKRAKLKTSPYLFALFLSPTGDGLKTVFRVPADASKHAGSFRAVAQHVRELTDVQIDESGKDLSRLCFMSYDPQLYNNPNAQEFEPLPEPEKPKLAQGSSGEVNLSERQRVAAQMLGNIEWTSQTSGYCVCPGKHLHTTGDGERDCEVFLSGEKAATVHCFHNHCRGIREGVNHELRSRIGKAEFVKPGTPRAQVQETPQWGEAQPLPEDMPPVPPFNFDLLPDTLRKWVQDISERMQCPPDFVAVAAIVALGSVIGRKVGIRPKRRDDWTELANLWGFIVARPGLLKTPSLQEALKPLRRLVAEALKRYEEESKKHDINEMLGAQRKKVVEEQIKKAFKKSAETKDDSEKEEAEKAAHENAKKHLEQASEKAVCRRYEVNDSTIEKLGELLAENPNGLLLVRDELSGFLRSLDDEQEAGDRQKYLEMWDGKGELTYDRIERGTVRILSNTLSILGGIQPDPLTAYVRQAVRGGDGADGLLQRFQIGVWPDVRAEWRNVDEWPNTEAKNEAFAVFKYLDHLTAESVGADTSDEIPFLRFTDDAQECFDVWHAELERRLRSGIEHPAFEGHLAKYRKLVPALALLLHLADRKTGRVSLAAQNGALLWADYLEAHARRIYSAVLRPDTAAARELAKHLQRGDLPERFKLREVYRKGWAGLSDKEDAEAATEILCDLGWIRPAVDTPVRAPGTPGRAASQMFEANPKISRHPSTATDKTDTTNSVGSAGDYQGVSKSFEGVSGGSVSDHQGVSEKSEAPIEGDEKGVGRL